MKGMASDVRHSMRTNKGGLNKLAQKPAAGVAAARATCPKGGRRGNGENWPYRAVPKDNSKTHGNV